MQALLSVSCVSQVKLALANSVLEKVLLFVKLVLVLTIVGFEASLLDSNSKKLFDRSIQSLAASQALNTSRWSTSKVDLASYDIPAFSRLYTLHNYSMVDLRVQQYLLSSEGRACQDIPCLMELMQARTLFEINITILDSSLCLSSICEEFHQQAVDEGQTDLRFYDVKPQILFQGKSETNSGRSLEEEFKKLIDNRWIRNETEEISINLLLRSTEMPQLYFLLLQRINFQNPVLADSDTVQHFFMISEAETYLVIVLLPILALSLVKPVIESGVSDNKLIHYMEIYTKMAWITWCVLRLSSIITARSYIKSERAASSTVHAIMNIDRASFFIAHVLFMMYPFEVLKLFKGSTFLKQFFNVLSVLYGSILSIRHYLFLLMALHMFLGFAVYGYFNPKIDSYFLVFLYEFLVSNVDVSALPMIDQIVFQVAWAIRMIIRVYLISALIVYLRIVTTHIFSEFEPKYFKVVKERVLNMNKSIENFQNDFLLKPTSTTKVKSKRVLIWLNFSGGDNDHHGQVYSLQIQRLFEEITKKGVGISFFTEFREVMSFMKSIYNIIPKIIMSTAKSVRIVVSVRPKGNRIELEHEIFAKMNDLNELIASMGLDIGILLFDETIQNVWKSKIYSILENSFSRIKVTNKMANLSRFCQMMPIEDIQTGGDAEEEFNNLLDGIEELP